MKTLKRILSLALVVLMSLTCLIGCKGEKPEPPAESKHDIEDVYGNYLKSEKKKSNFNMNMKMTMYMSVDDFVFGQKLSGSRIFNKGNIYASAQLESSNMSDNLLDTINGLLSILGNSASTDVENYLNSKSRFVGEVYYQKDGGVYNGRGDYLTGDEQADWHDNAGSTLWGTMNNDSVNTFLSDFGFGGEFKLSDYIMINSVVEVEKEDWIKSDTADTVYDKVNNRFNYRITAYKEKLLEYVKSQIKYYIYSIDRAKFPAELEFCDKYLDTVLNWVKVTDPVVTATANSEHVLTLLNTDFSVDITFTKSEVVNMLTEYLKLNNKYSNPNYDPENPLRKKDTELIGYLQAAMLLFTDSNRQAEKMTFSFGFSSQETFEYSEAAVSLDGVAPELLLGMEDNGEDRFIWDGRF